VSEARTEDPVTEKAAALGREFSVPIPYETHRDGSYMPRDVYGGLTKRELFAAMLMQGMIASESESEGLYRPETAATRAVKFADALLKELAK